MGAAWSVARLALQSAMAERPMGVIGPGMLGTKYAGHTGIAMTREAGICALGALARVRVRRSVRRKDVDHRAQQKHRRCGETPIQRPPHSIGRGGDVVNDLYIGYSARSMADTARLHRGGIGTRDGPTFGVFRDIGGTAILQHVGLRDGVNMTC